MTVKIPFVLDVSFQTETVEAIEKRLTSFLTDLRSARVDRMDISRLLDDIDDDEAFGIQGNGFALSSADKRKISARAKGLFERRQQHSGMAHLRKDEIAQLSACRSGVALRGPSTVHAVDELVAALTAEMPWMTPAIEPIWRDARARAEQRRAFGFKPILLVGPPGIGKTHLLRLLADLSNTPFVALDAAAAGDGFSIAGAQRTWGTAAPGRPLATIVETGCGNPIVLIDEIDKAGIARSTGGTVSSAWNALLGLLEGVSAVRWMCPFYSLSFDMSHINWVLAANSIDTVPAPLLSRCRVVYLEPLSRKQLLEVATRELQRRDQSPDLLDDVERLMAIIPDGHSQLSLRTLMRIIDAVGDIDRRPTWN